MVHPASEWEHGFFDTGSFVETLSMWAQTVVTGRALLGGIPCGVIAVETRSVECVSPADPANQDSESKVFIAVKNECGLEKVWRYIATFSLPPSLPPFLPLSLFLHLLCR